MKKLTNPFLLILILVSLTFASQSCEQKEKEVERDVEKEVIVESNEFSSRMKKLAGLL